MTLELLELLVCPEDKQSLEYLADKNVIYNPRLRRAYEVKNNIPVMLVTDARAVDAAEHEEFLKLIEAGAAVRTGVKEKA